MLLKSGRLNTLLQIMSVCMYVLIITGVQASGVIIDRLLRQYCFVWSEIVEPHSSGNFNDLTLKLKAGSKYRDALRDSI